MKKRTKLAFGSLMIAMLCLFIGFTIGRISTANPTYGVISSGDEQLLVGKWQMSIEGDDNPWIVEFRSDRTLIRYNPDGTRSVTATWGISGGELSIQNLQNGDSGGYMPPTILSVANLDAEKVNLTSRNNDAHFILDKVL